MTASEQKKFTILVGLAFLIIVLLWIVTWNWQSRQQQPNQSSVRSFFEHTKDGTAPGFVKLKNVTNLIFKRDNSTSY